MKLIRNGMNCNEFGIEWNRKWILNCMKLSGERNFIVELLERWVGLLARLANVNKTILIIVTCEWYHYLGKATSKFEWTVSVRWEDFHTHHLWVLPGLQYLTDGWVFWLLYQGHCIPISHANCPKEKFSTFILKVDWNV